MDFSEHSLYFILDQENDVHYTDSLLALDSPRFIWYQLRRSSCFRNILFLRLNNSDQMCIDVYDTESEKLLRGFKKPFLALTSNPGRVLAARFPELWLFEEELPQKLLKAANDQDGKTALVFTRRAYEKFCRHVSSAEILGELMSLLFAKATSYALFLRLPCQAEELEQLQKPDPTKGHLLAATYDLLRINSGEHPISLLEAMTDQLKDQLLRLDDQPQEMYHLLLKHAAADAGSADPLDALKEQANYLELCRTRRIGPFREEPGTEQFTPLSRRQAASRLLDPSIRNKLRCPRPEPVPDPLPVPAYTDKLARSALSLSLKGVDCPQKAEWSIKLDTIKRNLITLWNQPRNRKAVEFAQELCDNARSAITRKNWLCTEELMELLDFFSKPEQLCASGIRWEALGQIRQLGQDLIVKCDFIHGKDSITKVESLADITTIGIDKGQMADLVTLREKIRFYMRYFDDPESFQSDREGNEEYLGRVQQAYDSSQQAMHDRERCDRILQKTAQPAEDEHYLTSEAAAASAAFEPDAFELSSDELSVPASREEEAAPRMRFGDADVPPIDPNIYLQERNHRNTAHDPDVPHVYDGEYDYD